MKNVRYYLQNADYGRGVEVRIAKVDADKDVIAEAKPIEFVAVEPGDAFAYRQPTFLMEKHAAQNMLDELWQLGYRPTDGQMSVGQLQATERHLADFRAIAFAKLDIPKP